MKYLEKLNTKMNTKHSETNPLQKPIKYKANESKKFCI